MNQTPPRTRSNAIGNDHEVVALRREVTPIARYELEPMLLGDGRLKRIRKFPTVVPTKRRGEIRGRLIDSERWKAIQESRGFTGDALLKAGQNLRARYYGHSCIGIVRGQVVGSGRYAVEMIDQDDGIQQQLHLRVPHSPRSFRWNVSPFPKFCMPEVSRSRRSNPDGFASDSWRNRFTARRTSRVIGMRSRVAC